MEWTQANGERINIKRMAPSHLRNTINLLKRNKLDGLLQKKKIPSHTDMWIATMQKELDSRPIYDTIVNHKVPTPQLFKD
jgi:hypothetical protein